MPTRVLLLRHAETANPKVFHGFESDIGLSERGYRQAALVADYLATQSPQVLYSSGMRRARETAAAISRACSLPIRIEPDLHERRVGLLSGQPNCGPDNPWAETLRRWMAGETNYATEGAESFEAMRARILPAWQRCVSVHANQTLVIVAHGVVIRVLLISLLAGYSLADWKELGPIRNVAIHELIHDHDAWKAVRLNDLLPELREE